MIAKVEAYICFCDRCGGRIGDGEEEQDLLFNYYDEAKRYAERIGWCIINNKLCCSECWEQIAKEMDADDDEDDE